MIDNKRNERLIAEPGRDGFKGRAGEGNARPGDESARRDIPSKSHDL